MSWVHILGVEIVAGAVIRILTAYLLFYALTRLASKASVRHALWLVFLAASSGCWVAAFARLIDLQPTATSALATAMPLLVPRSAGSITTLRIPLSWNGFVSPAITFVLWIYIVCTAAMFLRVVRRRLELRQAVAQAQPAAPELETVFQKACAHLKISRCQILEAPGLTSPGTAYVWNPVVIMPEGVNADLDKEQLIDVLYHELTHIRRRDFLWSTFAEFAACLLFFHPAAWLALRNLARERELACDVAVMALRQGRRRDYALCLTRLARRQILGLQVAPPKHLALLNSFLAYRVKTLLAERRRRSPAIRVTAMLAGIAAVVLFAMGWSSFALAIEVEAAAPRVVAAVPSAVRPTARSMKVRRLHALALPNTEAPRTADAPPEANAIASQPTVFRFSPVDPSFDGGATSDADLGPVNARDAKPSGAPESDPNTPTSRGNSPSWQKTAADAAVGALSRAAAGRRDNDNDADNRSAKPF
jgi:beta-lactamase regulating signal transducer with metallopeptidase domain